MARITVFTAARMAAIEAASVVAGTINGSGHLILTRNDGSTFDAGAVLGSVPAASQTIAGLIELADNTEAAALTASDRALTPSNLPSVAASNTDVATGTATNRFVTPASLVSRLATTALTGLVRLATNAEAQAGTATDRAVTPAALASLVGTGPGYRYGGVIRITAASSTFTKATYPGLRAIKIRCQGAGASGGGAAVPPAGQHSQGGGGGAGGYAETFVLASALATSETVTIATGPAGVSGANGTNGGSTSFGAWAVAGGGFGGITAGSSALHVTSVGGDGGQGTTGDIVCKGEPGQPGTGTDGIPYGGNGGSCQFGGGGVGVYTGAGGGSLTGNAGEGFGSGGGGATANAGGVVRAGGAGKPGIILVELYY